MKITAAFHKILQQAKECIACGDCEARGTQHLPIIQRLAELP